MITYESICEKLEFDPIWGTTDIYDNLPDHEDDTFISPFSRLTFEESMFLAEYWEEARQEEGKQRGET